jgi:hypothetical protein
MVSSKGNPQWFAPVAAGLEMAVEEDFTCDSDELWIQFEPERFTKSSLR